MGDWKHLDTADYWQSQILKTKVELKEARSVVLACAAENRRDKGWRRRFDDACAQVGVLSDRINTMTRAKITASLREKGVRT